MGVNNNSSELPQSNNNSETQTGGNNVIIKKLSNLPLKIVVIVVVLTIVVVASALFLFKGEPNNKKVSALLNSASQADTSGDYKKSEELYKEANTIKPGNAEIQASLINAISSRGNQTGTEDDAFKNSEPYITEAVSTNPNDFNVNVAVGYAYETAGNYAKAFEYYEKAVMINPKSATALFHQAHTLEFLGKHDEAYEMYAKARKLDPNNPLVLMAHGNQLMASSDLQGSYQSFLDASNQPGISRVAKVEALTAAASVRAIQNNFQYIGEALKLSKEAVEVDSNFSPALATYGYTLYLTTPIDGDKSQAFDYLKRAITANPKISKNYLTLSKFYRVKSDYPSAISYNKQAIERANDDNTLLSPQARILNKGIYEYELAKTYYSSGQPELVMPALISAVQSNPYIKETIKDEFSNKGQFTDFVTNSEFISLITK